MPGWHPFLVHFPIAFLPLSVAIDLIAAVTARRYLHSVAYLILVAGTVAAAAAVISGNSAAAPYRDVAVVGEAVADHEDSGTIALVICLAVTLVRLPAQLRGETSGKRLWIAVAAAAIGCAVAWRTSLLGGELVYGYGVGVEQAVLERLMPGNAP